MSKIPKIRPITRKYEPIIISSLQRQLAVDLIKFCRKYKTAIVAENNVVHCGHLRFSTVNPDQAHIVTRDYKHPGTYVYKTSKRIRSKT